MPKHLIASDLDGTLFNPEAEISPVTLDALRRANEAGYHTVAVTGRSRRTASHRLKPASGIEYIICANGAYLYEQTTASVRWESTIAPDALRQLRTRVQRTVPDACFGEESFSGISFEPEFLALAADPGALEQGGLDPGTQGLQAERVYKLFIRSAQHSAQELLSLLTPELEHIACLSTSGAPFVEATAAGTDKASALARLATELDITAENTIAFGDNLNDLPMLEWAGTSVAMENALPQVKAIADEVTLSNRQHGVARYLNALFN